MFFTTKDRTPKDRKITYENFICNICPQKSETHCVRLTAGGDKLDYPGNPSYPAVSLLNVKIHINSTISRAKHNAIYMCMDIKKLLPGNSHEVLPIHAHSSPKKYSMSTTSSSMTVISPTWKYSEACTA